MSNYSTLDNLHKPTSRHSTNVDENKNSVPSTPSTPYPSNLNQVRGCISAMQYIEQSFPATRDISGCQHNWILTPYQANDNTDRGICNRCFLYTVRSKSKLG